MVEMGNLFEMIVIGTSPFIFNVLQCVRYAIWGNTRQLASFPSGLRTSTDSSLQRDLLQQVDSDIANAVTGNSLDVPPSSLTELQPPMSSNQPQTVQLKDIERYRDWLPADLKSDYCDAMILYHDDDLEEVKKFLSYIEHHVQLKQKQNPKIFLYTEVRPDVSNQVGQLDYSLPMCTYILLYITEKFCLDSWMEFSSHVCLMESINDPEKKWSVIPIFTESKQKGSYKIPASIRSLKGIRYWNKDKFDPKQVQMVLEDKLHVRIGKQDELDKKRIEWINKKEADRRKQIEEIHVPQQVL